MHACAYAYPNCIFSLNGKIHLSEYLVGEGVNVRYDLVAFSFSHKNWSCDILLNLL